MDIVIKVYGTATPGKYTYIPSDPDEVLFTQEQLEDKLCDAIDDILENELGCEDWDVRVCVAVPYLPNYVRGKSPDAVIVDEAVTL